VHKMPEHTSYYPISPIPNYEALNKSCFVSHLTPWSIYSNVVGRMVYAIMIVDYWYDILEETMTWFISHDTYTAPPPFPPWLLQGLFTLFHGDVIMVGVGIATENRIAIFCDIGQRTAIRITIYCVY
jgi:hypothetical protein